MARFPASWTSPPRGLGTGALALDGVTGKAAFAVADWGAPALDATLEFKRLRAPGADGLPGTLFVRLDGQGIAVRGAVRAPNERLTFEAQGAPGKAFEFKAKGRLSIGALLAALKSKVEGRGFVAFDLAGNLANPFDLPADPVDALTLSGTINASFDQIAVPALFRGGSARGKIGLSLRPGNWRFTSDGLRLSAASLAKELLARLPDAAQDRLDGGVRLTVSGPASLRITPRGDRYGASFDGALRLEAADLALGLRGAFDATTQRWTAAGRYMLDGSHRAMAAKFLAPLIIRAGLRGGFNLTDNILTIDAGPDSRITIAKIAIPDLAQTTVPVALSPVQPFRAEFDLAGTPRLATFGGTLAMTRNRLAVTAGPARFAIDVAAVTLAVSGTQNRLQIAIEDAALTLPAYRFDARKIAVALRINDAAALTVSVGDISQRGPNPVAVPMRFDANATRRGDEIAFSGRLYDRPERLSIRATGQYDIAANSGGASIVADPLVFLPTVLQPRQMFPVLGESLRAVDGQIGGQARLQWRAGDFRSSAELFIQLNSLKVEGATVEDAAATVVFDSLFPLSTPPNQEIHIGRLDIGVPLIKGRIEFQIRRDGAVRAALREVDFFGGRIESPMIAVPPSLDGFSVPLFGHRRATGIAVRPDRNRRP